jgi:hypothetical protein
MNSSRRCWPSSIVSFRDWLRRLRAENPAAMHRRHALVNVGQG